MHAHYRAESARHVRDPSLLPAASAGRDGPTRLMTLIPLSAPSRLQTRSVGYGERAELSIWHAARAGQSAEVASGRRGARTSGDLRFMWKTDGQWRIAWQASNWFDQVQRRRPVTSRRHPHRNVSSRLPCLRSWRDSGRHTTGTSSSQLGTNGLGGTSKLHHYSMTSDQSLGSLRF